MITTDKVSVDVFEINGVLKVISQFDLAGISIKKDEQGRINNETKIELEKALKKALLEWSFG